MCLLQTLDHPYRTRIGWRKIVRTKMPAYLGGVDDADLSSTGILQGVVGFRFGGHMRQREAQNPEGMIYI